MDLRLQGLDDNVHSVWNRSARPIEGFAGYNYTPTPPETIGAMFRFGAYDVPRVLNDFTGSPLSSVRVWEGLTGWYTAKTGVDNSLPLQAIGASPFGFVNYARLPGRAVPFLVNQLTRPSFHTFVRRRLKTNGMVALPLLCRPV
ncbi:hypothetical protein GCM10022205_25340 [Spinactinospora alkalitolerans]